jgi:hypothetical protein
VWNDLPVDAVTRYCEASERNDLDGLVQTLSADIELISPVAGRMMFRGREDVGVLLAATEACAGYGGASGSRKDARSWSWGIAGSGR